MDDIVNGQDGTPKAPAPPVKSNAELAEGMYSNYGGSAGFAPVDLRVFDQLEHQARYDGKKGLASEIAGARKTLTSNLMNLDFSGGAARELSNLIGEYHRSPREGDQVKENLASAMEQLADEWDSDFQQNFDGAMQVLKEVTKGNPSLVNFFHSTGLSSDVRFLRMAGNIAKGRKAGKK